jgi:alpha-1,3-rhamnosyl/mannosyltransferase
MNVVFDGRVVQDHFPGIGRYAYNLLTELPGALGDGESLTALYDPTVRNTRLPALGPALTSADAGDWRSRVEWVEYRMPVFSLKNVLVTPQFRIRDAGVDILHYPYYVRPRASQPPSVTSIFDAIAFKYPNYLPSAQARLSIRLLHQIAIGASRVVLTLSQSAAGDLAQVFPSARAKLRVTPLAPDPVFTPPSPDTIARTQAKFDIDLPFAFYLASNKPHKNLVRLVEAWALVRASLSSLAGGRDWPANSPTHAPHLIIAGHVDPRYPQAQQRAEALGLQGSVRFIGAVSDADAAALYRACDLFVYPSLYEGFGLTPLEAMACGAPVACSNASSLPEVAGDAALLFDPTEPEFIAQACLRVLRDDALRAALRSRGLAQAARFNWRDTARLTIAAYRSAARDRSVGSNSGP